MARQRDLVKRYLEAVHDGRVEGTAILFDGPPDVGRSELARLLARHFGFDAYELNEVDPDGDPAMPGGVTDRLARLLKNLQ